MDTPDVVRLKLKLINQIKKLPEMISLYNACIFNSSFSVPVIIKIEPEFSVEPFDDYCEGYVYAGDKQPKGYNIMSFFEYNSLNDLGMDRVKRLRLVCPEFVKQLDRKVQLEKKLEKKVNILVQKSGINFPIKDLIVNTYREMCRKIRMKKLFTYNKSCIK